MGVKEQRREARGGTRVNKQHKRVRVARSLTASGRKLRPGLGRKAGGKEGKGERRKGKERKRKGKGERSERADGERTEASRAARWRRGTPLPPLLRAGFCGRPAARGPLEIE